MKIIVIGKGAGGISAAIYAKRAGADVTIIAKDYGAIAKASSVENYYGFALPVSGIELAKNGEQQALAHGINVICDEVVGLDYDESLVVLTSTARYTCDKIIMATGTSRAFPAIQNFSAFVGKGISYCAKCDAFAVRGKVVAVVGSGQYALHEARELLPTASRVYILTNGRPLTVQFDSAFSVVEGKLSTVEGENNMLSAVVFASGERLAISGLFIAMHSASTQDFLRKFGLPQTSLYVDVDKSTMLTGIPNIYAVGDSTGGELQLAQAVYQGMMAAIHATKELK